MYYYLVSNYAIPTALIDGVWSLYVRLPSKQNCTDAEKGHEIGIGWNECPHRLYCAMVRLSPLLLTCNYANDSFLMTGQLLYREATRMYVIFSGLIAVAK